DGRSTPPRDPRPHLRRNPFTPGSAPGGTKPAPGTRAVPIDRARRARNVVSRRTLRRTVPRKSSHACLPSKRTSPSRRRANSLDFKDGGTLKAASLCGLAPPLMAERKSVLLIAMLSLTLASGGVASASISSSLDQFINRQLSLLIFPLQGRFHFPNVAGEFLQRVALGSIQLPIPANSTS